MEVEDRDIVRVGINWIENMMIYWIGLTSTVLLSQTKGKRRTDASLR